jgi:hypothetical protein
MRVGMKIAIATKRFKDLKRFPELHKSVEQVSMQPRTVWKINVFEVLDFTTEKRL